MRNRKTIILVAIGYAAFFTLFLIWWTGASEVSAIAILTLVGAANGLVWYWLFSSGTRWMVARRRRSARSCLRALEAIAPDR